MAIRNLEDLSNQEMVTELHQGGKFVVFQTTISIVVMTFRPTSHIYFLRAGQPAIRFGWKFLLTSLLLGWWGFPWGPVYTIQSFILAFRGKDVTKEVLAQMARGTAPKAVVYPQ